MTAGQNIVQSKGMNPPSGLAIALAMAVIVGLVVAVMAVASGAMRTGNVAGSTSLTAPRFHFVAAEPGSAVAGPASVAPIAGDRLQYLIEHGFVAAPAAVAPATDDRLQYLIEHGLVAAPVAVAPATTLSQAQVDFIASEHGFGAAVPAPATTLTESRVQFIEDERGSDTAAPSSLRQITKHRLEILARR